MIMEEITMANKTAIIALPLLLAASAYVQADTNTTNAISVNNDSNQTIVVQYTSNNDKATQTMSVGPNDGKATEVNPDKAYVYKILSVQPASCKFPSNSSYINIQFDIDDKGICTTRFAVSAGDVPLDRVAGEDR